MKAVNGFVALALVLFAANARTQSEPTGVPVGPCKTWVDGTGWVPCPDSGGESVTTEAPSGPSQRQLDREADRARRSTAAILEAEGLEAWKRGDWGIAGEKFQQAFAQAPDSKSIRRRLAECRFKQGVVASDQGDWEEAANDFNSACLYDPRNAEFKRRLELARRKVEERRNADKNYRNAFAQNERGRAAAERGEWSAAQTFFEAAMALVPDESAYRRNVSLAKSQQGDRAWKAGDQVAALAFWKSAIATDPGNQYAQDISLRAQRVVDVKRIEASGLAKARSDLGVMAADLNRSTPPATGLDFLAGDASVVDLRDVRSFRIDPARVKGALGTAAGATRLPAASLKEMVTAMNAQVIALGWPEEERKHLIHELNALGEDGTPGTTVRDSYEVWSRIAARDGDAALRREAAKAEGVGFPGAGEQSTNDCTLFALANAARLPYGVVAARATRMIAAATWRDPDERANPASVFTKGLNGQEVILLAEAFGRAHVVPSTAFVETLSAGIPILLAVILTEKDNGLYGQGFHEVVLTRSFRHAGERWFEMMDSNRPATERRYVTEKDLGVIMFENGVALHPEPESFK